MLRLDKTLHVFIGHNTDMNTQILDRRGKLIYRKQSNPVFAFVLLHFLLLFIAPNSTWAQSVDPEAVLAQAKQASGGDAWNRVHTLHLQYRTVAGGLTGTQEEWDDVQTGRYAVLSKRPSGARADGFDGVSVWTQAPGGYSYVLGDEDARQGAVNEAYQTCRAFWFPERYGATLASAGTQQENGHVYDVISITPQAGRSFSIWVDQATHLIDRFIEQQGEDVQIIRLLDYHPVADGVKLPFTVRVGDGNPRWDEVDTMQSAAINVPLAPDRFELPPNPAPDFEFRSGKTLTTIPFRLTGNKILVPIRLNGQGPFEAELDSGGNYIVQPELAQRLHLTTLGTSQEGGGGESFVAAGRATVSSVELGDLRLTGQAYKILSFSGSAPDRTLIGLQIFQRFVVSINFDRNTLTLTQPDYFTYQGTGTAVPFHFQDNQPEVSGSVDGIAGVFTVDTGDNGSLLLIAPFAQRYGLVARYGATISYGGSAVGGATHGLMTRVGSLTLFGADGRPTVSVDGPLTRLSQQAGGFDADRYVSGNVGIGILKQFNLIFDYSRQRIIFEKNHNYGEEDIYNRTGLQLRQSGAEWDVVAVVAGSPGAQQGIRPGDKIVSINGQTAAQLTTDDLNMLFHQSVGTKVAIQLRSGTVNRQVAIRLRNLL